MVQSEGRYVKFKLLLLRVEWLRVERRKLDEKCPLFPSTTGTKRDDDHSICRCCLSLVPMIAAAAGT